MWKSNGTTIEMTAGDYGIGLPIKISGVEFGQSDSVKLRISSARNLATRLTLPRPVVLTLTKITPRCV